MLKYHIDQVNEDMVLGQSVFSNTGEMLLAAGFRIKKQYCERLKQLGYTNLMVEVEGTENVIPSTTVSEDNQREMLNAITSSSTDMSKMAESYRQKGVKAVEDVIRENRQHLGKYIMSAGIAAALEKFIADIMSQSEIVLNLNAMQQANHELFAHTMNVTITALCIARKCRFSYEEMKQLGIGALNYDLGLMMIPKEVMEKPAALSNEEKETYHRHPIYGYLILSENTAIPATSSAVALQHHEHQNGTGFPNGTKGENRPPLKDFTRQNMIHRFAEIVAVADQYDMLINGRRHFCAPLPIHDVIKQILLRSGPILNSEIVKTFLSIVPIYPVGVRIRIIEAPTAQLVGYCGAVAKDNPANLEKPFIVLYENKSGERVPPFSVDLSQHDGFVLEAV